MNARTKPPSSPQLSRNQVDPLSKSKDTGCVVWFTGPPSAGKTTLARLLEHELNRRHRAVELLDGDDVRRILNSGLGFSREDRDKNVRRVAYIAKLLQRHGVIVLAALVSPYRKAREEARGSVGQFVEVYVKCQMAECIRRDVKGLYRKALTGEIENFTGVSDPYEPPLSPEVVVETDRESPEECVGRVIYVLQAHGYLSGEPESDEWTA